MNKLIILLIGLNALAAIFFLVASVSLETRQTFGRKLAIGLALLFLTNTLVLFWQL